MRQLSAEGQQAVNDLAQRHGFSPDAVASMLDSVANGNGGMAQFSHPEFGGSGQWMQGGMTMIGDMFNNYLKGRVDSLCQDLAGLLNSRPGFMQAGSFQSQTQGGMYQPVPTPAGASNLFQQATGGGGGGNWWPQDLGFPNSSGGQNNVRYAYFAGPHRLAVDVGGTVSVYDTQAHQIGGVSQQQGTGGSVIFTSQFGTVDLLSLPIVSGPGTRPPPPPPAAAPPVFTPAPQSEPMPAPTGHADILAAIEKLGDLHGRGILNDAEFSAKKSDLLARL